MRMFTDGEVKDVAKVDIDSQSAPRHKQTDIHLLEQSLIDSLLMLLHKNFTYFIYEHSG